MKRKDAIQQLIFALVLASLLAFLYFGPDDWFPVPLENPALRHGPFIILMIWFLARAMLKWWPRQAPSAHSFRWRKRPSHRE